jgi:hypothetical protein
MAESDNKRLPQSQRKHFTRCRICGEWFDSRGLEELLFHTVDRHVRKPGVTYKALKRAQPIRRAATKGALTNGIEGAYGHPSSSK